MSRSVRNIFVVGLDDFNLQTLQGLRESGRYAVHRLLPTDDVVKADDYDYDELVARADAELRAFDGTVDGVVTWWDFPSSGLTPMIAELWDLYGPSLESVVRLEHKYWSRRTQRAVAAEHVPAFAAFDPDDSDVLQTVQAQGVQLPFWIKPVKSVASYLGFRIDTPEDLDAALKVIRAEIDQLGDPFEQAMAHVDLPPNIARVGGRACLAEGIIGGRQCTLEGYVSFGEVTIYGVVDSIREDNQSTFRAYQYPSRLPMPIQRRMADIATDVIHHAGLDHSCFNIEFFYDESIRHLWLLEVNTRLSASHCDLFAKVDGASSQRALLGVATGHEPRMPRRYGEYPVAAKYFLRVPEDGVVRSVPDEATLAEAGERFPSLRWEFDVALGDRLSDVLSLQESYSWELGRVWFGADDHDDLERRFGQIQDLLAFEIE